VLFRSADCENSLSEQEDALPSTKAKLADQERVNTPVGANPKWAKYERQAAEVADSLHTADSNVADQQYELEQWDKAWAAASARLADCEQRRSEQGGALKSANARPADVERQLQQGKMEALAVANNISADSESQLLKRENG
jgi:hypothetical protein